MRCAVEGFVEALDDLVAAFSRTVAAQPTVEANAERLKAEHEQGTVFADVVASPHMGELRDTIGSCVSDLIDAGARFRRLLARSLHDEGMTMEQIASLLGVSRQRVSVLLSRRRHDD
jgi:hypothetical protein